MSELKPGTICRITHSLFPSNINKLVTYIGSLPPDWAERFPEGGVLVETLQSMDALDVELGVIFEVPPGSQMQAMREHIKPLGDEGPEESDLFGIPKDTESGKQLANLMELLK